MAKTNYDSIDIAKAVLCIFIMLIHLNPFRGGVEENCIYPIVCISVPLFFVFSSYFFFSKVNYSWVHDKVIVQRFVLRNLKLYAFWFVVLLPLTIFFRHYFSLGFIEIVKALLTDFLLGFAFRASWFIIALVEGMLIVYALRKIMPKWAVVVFSAILYTFCCMDSNYHEIFANLQWFQWLIGLYPTKYIYYGFPSALLWLSIGMCITEREKRGQEIQLSRIVYISGIVISMGILYAEQYIIDVLECMYRRECYFTLAPLVILSFLAVKQWNVSCKSAKSLREYSTIAYCSHYTMGLTWAIVLRKIFHLPNCYWLVFLLAVATTILLTYLITRVEHLPHLTWLKYAH